MACTSTSCAGPPDCLYRALAYGERATTKGTRQLVGEQRALLKDFPRRRISAILRNAIVWADLHELYGDNLGDALLGKYEGRSRPWLSKATSPFYHGLGVRLARGPQAGELPRSVPAERAESRNVAT